LFELSLTETLLPFAWAVALLLKAVGAVNRLLPVRTKRHLAAIVAGVALSVVKLAVSSSVSSKRAIGTCFIKRSAVATET
jgi:hypothetical protein